MLSHYLFHTILCIRLHTASHPHWKALRLGQSVNDPSDRSHFFQVSGKATTKSGELLSHSALAHPVTTPPPLANEVLPWCSGMSSRMSHPPLPVPSYPVTKINR